MKPSTHPRVPYFKGDRGEIHDVVVQEMRTVLAATDEPEWLDENAKVLLRCARRVGQQAGILAAGVIADEAGVRWYPWRGTKIIRTLELFARRERVTPSVDLLSLHYPGWDEKRLRRHWRAIAQFDEAPTELSDLMANKCFEKFDAFVPPALINAANARDRLDLSGARALAGECLGRLGNAVGASVSA